MVISSRNLKFFRTFSRRGLTHLTLTVKANNFSSEALSKNSCDCKVVSKGIHKIPPAAMASNAQRTLEQVERSLTNWLKPQILGESWDNIGLLVGSGKYEKNEKVISRIMLCNDLMPAVLEEAINKQADMIFAYHPPIFTGMKAISYGSWKERIVARCLANDICIYSPHTTLDSTVGGINDRVLDALRGPGVNENSPVRPIIPSTFLDAESQGVLFVSSSENITLLLDRINFQSYSDVLIAVGTTGQSAMLSVYSKSNLDEIRQLVSDLNIPDLSISNSNESDKPAFGAGRIVILNEAVLLDEAIEAIKNHLGLGYVQLAYGGSPYVKSTAVCVGSGSSLLKPIAGKIDLLITGEMSHHDILECVVKKSSVVLCNHCSSERHYLADLAENLKVVTGLNNIFVSEEDCSPLRLVL